jgi:DNA-binding NarL/FixJ family response regulator
VHVDGEPAASPPRVRVRVAIADDSFLMREALGQVLAQVPGVHLIASCENGAALLEAVEDLAPSVVVTDLRMPPSGDTEGLRVANELHETHPEIGVIVLSQFAEPRDVLTLLSKGAEGRGYLLKERVRAAIDLGLTIEAVSRGGSVVDPAVVSLLLSAQPSEGEPSPLDELTPREHEVLAEMAQGRSNAGIAKTLFLTQRAVEKYVGSVFRKLGVPDEESVSRRVAAVLVYLDRASKHRSPQA